LNLLLRKVCKPALIYVGDGDRQLSLIFDPLLLSAVIRAQDSGINHWKLLLLKLIIVAPVNDDHELGNGHESWLDQRVNCNIFLIALQELGRDHES
jgi:hypothetical protein